VRAYRIERDCDEYVSVHASAWPIRPDADAMDGPEDNIPQEYGIDVMVRDDECEIEYEVVLNDADVHSLISRYLRLVVDQAYGKPFRPSIGGTIETTEPTGVRRDDNWNIIDPSITEDDSPCPCILCSLDRLAGKECE
jgi:hypothetical protein